MNTNEFIDFIPIFFEKLKEDHMSQSVIDTNKWVINHFKKYCLRNNIQEINMEIIKEFYSRQYDIDIYNFKCSIQTDYYGEADQEFRFSLIINSDTLDQSF